MDHARRTRDARRWRAGCALILLGALALGSVTPKPLAQETGANPAAAQPAPIRFEEVARFEVRPETSGQAFDTLAFTPDGGVLVLLTDRGEALLLDAATGREVARLRGVRALSPDKRWLVTRGGDGSARLIETATGTEAMAIGPAMSLAFSFDGRVLAVTQNKSQPSGTTTRLIDTAARREVGSFTIETPLDIFVYGVSPYGRWTTSADELHPVIGTANGQVLVRLRTSSPHPSESFVSSPDGRWEASVTPNTQVGSMYFVRVFEAGSDRMTAETACFGGRPKVAFSPDGRWLSIARCDGPTLMETATGTVRLRLTAIGLENPQYADSIAFSPDSRWLAQGGRRSAQGTAAGWVHEVLLIDTTTGAVLTRVPQEGRVEGVAFSPDGSLLAMVSTARSAADTTGPEVRPPTTVRLLRVDR